MKPIQAAITGVQGYVPEYVLSNAELEKMVDTTDEWITSRTGIKERRLLKGEGLGASYMGIQAAKGLLEKTQTDAKEIDMLICATATPDMVFPATANLIAQGIGCTADCLSYDIMAACSGFLFALTTASKFIETGVFKKIIVVGTDKMSSIIDYTDRQTCVIFGDGAGAVLLEANTEGNGLIDHILRSDGAGSEFLYMKAGGSRYPASTQTVANKEHYVTQHGSVVFKHAVKNMADTSYELVQRNGLSADEIAYLVPHQANLRIIDATAERLGLNPNKVLINIQRYGNTTNGTIPLCLWDFESQFKKGDNLVLAAFGGGFTWGAAYLKWAY
ncbi:beta-ketoacyl-ACP synthase III [Hugenholtzia roseola]|uniref:beta-ketoacyl-ACP synthase III n=1 Tax=Hugenholtzia roseola TaxID=1002 RepID=UPI00041002AD|nr:beta-ketoacyl-ACP synthase III [Hugenholtzia roseola]